MQESSQSNEFDQTEPKAQGSVPGAASGLADEARDKAREVAGRAQELADGGKSKLAEGADGLAEALHHASDNFRSDDQAEVARYTGSGRPPDIIKKGALVQGSLQSGVFLHGALVDLEGSALQPGRRFFRPVGFALANSNEDAHP